MSAIALLILLPIVLIPAVVFSAIIISIAHIARLATVKSSLAIIGSSIASLVCAYLMAQLGFALGSRSSANFLGALGACLGWTLPITIVLAFVTRSRNVVLSTLAALLAAFAVLTPFTYGFLPLDQYFMEASFFAYVTWTIIVCLSFRRWARDHSRKDPFERHCWRCNYDLTGIRPDACPECGLKLNWKPRRCAECGYSLKGIKSNTCPECGATITPRDTDQPQTS